MRRELRKHFERVWVAGGLAVFAWIFFRRGEVWWDVVGLILMLCALLILAGIIHRDESRSRGDAGTPGGGNDE